MTSEITSRMTRQRRAAVQAVERMCGAFTVDELADTVRGIDAASASSSTVYRAVAAMEQAGHIERVGTREGAALYARCEEKDHHHHIVCESCGRVEPAECPLPAVGTRGFVVTRHEVTMYGICPTCADGQA